MCDPPSGVLDEIVRRRPKCVHNKKCNRKKNNCGRAWTTGHFNKCRKYKNNKCRKRRYDGFIDMIEETVPDTEIDTDLDYGSTGYGISRQGT